MKCNHIFDGPIASAHTTLEGLPSGEGSVRCSKCGLTEDMHEYLQTKARARAKERRQHIEVAAKDLIGSFMYYDRKEDDDLPRGAIEEAIDAGDITIEEILWIFETGLRA